MTSGEGVIQGDPLLMVIYGLDFLPLIISMRMVDPGVLQPWYIDDAAMRGTARENSKLLHALIRGSIPAKVEFG